MGSCQQASPHRPNTVPAHGLAAGNFNGDGKIDLAAAHSWQWLPAGTSGWFNGDFNYDGKINVDDYGIIDFNIGIQGAPLGVNPAAAGSASSPLMWFPSHAADVPKDDHGGSALDLLT